MSDFENYIMKVTYQFDSNFPTALKQTVRDAYTDWEVESNGKFDFTEVSSNAYITIGWYNDNTTNSERAFAALPVTTMKGYHIGDLIQFNEHYFDLVNGLDKLAGDSDQEVKNKVKFTALHEIGHTLGLAHWDQTNDHISGTLINSNQSGVHTVMHPFLGVGSPAPSTTLYPDDILSIQTLYNYNNSGLTCACDDSPPNIQTEGFSMMWALGDVNFNGTVSSTDLVLIKNDANGSYPLPAYAAQKAAAIQRNSDMTVVADDDRVELSQYLIGNKPWTDDIVADQFTAMADFNMDGILTTTGDATCSILICSSSEYSPTTDYSNRSNFNSDAHKTCAMIDGNGSDFYPVEYNTWVANF